MVQVQTSLQINSCTKRQNIFHTCELNTRNLFLFYITWLQYLKISALFRKMEMDYASFVQQNQMSPLDYYLESLNFQSFTSETSNEFINNQRSESSLSYSERPMKQMKTNSWSSCTTEQSTPSHIISFENSISSPAIPKIEIVSDINLPGLISHQSRASPSTTRNALQAQDHVIAERKRREKLSQRFIALSSLIPGLKKVFSIQKIWRAY